MRRNSLFWGVVIIVVGLLLLLGNMGLLPVSAWVLIWPVALILLGVWFLLAPVLRRNLPAETRSLSIPLEGASEGDVRLHHGAGRLDVSALSASSDLMSGTFTGGVEESVSREAGRVKLKLRAPTDDLFLGPWSVGSEGYSWQLGLSPDVPLRLVVKSGASDTTLDLTNLRVTELKVETGASKTSITFPERAGFTRAEIGSGAARIDLRIPQGVGAHIRVKAGLTGISVDTGRFIRQGDYYETQDYVSAANKVDVQVETGVGEINIL